MDIDMIRVIRRDPCSPIVLVFPPGSLQTSMSQVLPRDTEDQIPFLREILTRQLWGKNVACAIIRLVIAPCERHGKGNARKGSLMYRVKEM
uniref:Uncharacterized protein n=1 Tax=Cucumis melo TaxID=3656 RepID=A0A9I9EEQ7_CUCME